MIRKIHTCVLLTNSNITINGVVPTIKQIIWFVTLLSKYYILYIFCKCVYYVYWILCSLPKKGNLINSFFGSPSLVVGEWVCSCEQPTFLSFLSTVYSQSDSIHNEIVVVLPLGLLTVNHHQLTIQPLGWKREK